MSAGTMTCPHCLKAVHVNREIVDLGEDSKSFYSVFKRLCPHCGRYVFTLFERYDRVNVGGRLPNSYYQERETLFFPKGISRTPIGPEVPGEFANDYKEACVTLGDSPKASAALSRRCLQHLLREKAGVKKADLAHEIQEAIGSGKLPTQLVESLDAIRNIGNFAAHPIKTTATGEIIEVEIGEAEWNLDVLEALFDFYFVQPALLQKKRDALNAKLKAAGKPEMK